MATIVPPVIPSDSRMPMAEHELIMALRRVTVLCASRSKAAMFPVIGKAYGYMVMIRLHTQEKDRSSRRQLRCTP